MSRQVATAMALAAILATTAAKAEGGAGNPRVPPTALPLAPPLAQAQPSPGDGLRTFDIPPQPLGSALNAFGRQAGLQVSVEASVASGVQVQGVSGTMRPEQALNQLLAGTGIVARFTPDRGFILSKPDLGGALQLDPVRVQGYPVPPQAMIDNLPPPYAGGQVATGGQLGLLGDRDVMDTPFNQTNYTAKKAQDQQAKTVRDVLIDDPSARSYLPSEGISGDGLRIRGFDVNAASTSYGGLYGMLPRDSIMVELAERVEVLKGPSAMLNGMPPDGSIGGTVNVVPKRAPDDGLTQATANYVSAGQFGGHVDLARRVGPEKQFGVRFNGVFKAGQTEVEWNSDQRSLAIFGMDFRGENVRLSADLGYQYRYIGGVTPFLGLNADVPLPWAPDARKNQGQPWGWLQNKDLFGVARAEVDLTERITAYAAIGAHDYRYGALASSFAFISSFNGDATAFPTNQSIYVQALTATGGVRARVETGPIGHEFGLTATTLEQTTGSALLVGTPTATNIYSPTVVTAPPGIPTPAANKTSTQGLSSLGIADTLTAADKRIQLTAGLRLQNVTSQNYDATTGQATTGYDQSALSPSVALVFKPWQNVSVYGNWIQGLQQGLVVQPPFSNAGEVFPPFKSTQYEAGVKVDWGKFTTTVSLFQITQPFTLTNLENNTLSLAGEQRNQGLEINVFGEPMEGVRLLGGAMFLSPVLTKTEGGLTDGWIAPFSPQLNLNLSAEWDLPFVRGLTLNGRVIYTSSQYVDTSWPRRSLPDWTRFDLGARYTFENPGAKGKLLVARFNVENVLDADYWAGGQSVSQLNLGAPRTFRVSLTADF